MKKYAIITVTLIILAYIGTNYARWDQTLLDKTIEFNNGVYAQCFSNTKWFTWTIEKWKTFNTTVIDTARYQASTACWQSQRRFTPDDLFLTVPKSLVDEGKCSISQSEDDHVNKINGGMYATDLACNFKSQGVYAPDYLDEMKEYIIESTGSDTLLGNFVILSFKGTEIGTITRWYFWHTVLDKWWKVGDTMTTWVRFAKADLSGATTGWHTHIELRRMYDGVWQSVRYVTRGKEKNLEERRNWKNNITWPVGTYYFTHYDLWDKSQNDAAPCISADWKDSCLLMRQWRNTMALTVDVRKSLWINFWDKVVLMGDVWCKGVYTVTDELACRFRGEYAWTNGPCYYSDKVTHTPRISNILRPGTSYFIKGDLPWEPGWACTISKL